MATDLFRPQFRIATFFRFTAVCCLILALFHWSGVDLTMGLDSPFAPLYPLGIAMVCALSYMRPKLVRTRCQECGRTCRPRWQAEPLQLCSACRVAKLPPEQHRRLAMQGFLIIAVLIFMLPVVLLWPFPLFVQTRHSVLAYLLAVAGLFVVFFILFVGAMVLRAVAGMWRMSSPRYALKAARASAGEFGKTTTVGPMSVYVFGSNDPSAMLKGQMESCRTRFESLVGEDIEAERPLRVFAFGRRDAFDRFFRRVCLYVSNLDGMFIPWPTRTIALTTEYAAFRLPDPQRMARIVMSYYYLDAYKGSPSPLWLQSGIANVVTCGGDNEELARLKRRVLADVSRGTSLGAQDLFHVNPGALTKMVRDWQGQASFLKFTQLGFQSWSVVEYLCGNGATEPRRAQFRIFLKDVGTKKHAEEVFDLHFGYGFDALLEDWRKWVATRGIGFHSAPPAHVRHAILDCVIPIVKDRHARALDRVQAVRELGRAGYALGADALIALIDGDGLIPTDEVVWALESISGLAYGRDAKRWARWYANLPDHATCVAALA